MARGSFWDELGRDRDRRRRADAARLKAEAQIRKDERRTNAGSRRDEAALERADRDAEATERQAELDARMAELTAVLRTVVAFPVPTIDELRDSPPDVEPEPRDETAPRWADFAPPESGLLGRFGRRRAETEAKARLDEAYAAFVRRRAEAAERHRRRVAEAREEHEHRLDELVAAAYRQDQDAVPELAAATLEQVIPLGRLIRGGRGFYRPEARELGVEVDLPDKDVIPPERGWIHVVNRRTVRAERRSSKETTASYVDLISQSTLATVATCFRAFPVEIVDTVTVNGHVTTTDPATGRPDHPCLVSVSTDRATFNGLRLDDPDLDALTCLHNLRAEGPDNPHALRNVTPLLDIDLESRYRLITSPEELARLDHRTDLMQMDPYEFERLIAALFRAKGYEAWHTQSSRDDGIDAIATKRDAHVPVECLIQVKRTRNVVPPKEIQALMGALTEHPTATNGLLVTTSWFSDRSRRRGWDRRIGTMEGGELREQIKTHLERDVVISATPPRRRR